MLGDSGLDHRAAAAQPQQRHADEQECRARGFGGDDGIEAEGVQLTIDRAGGCNLSAVIDAVAKIADGKPGHTGAGQKKGVEIIHHAADVEEGSFEVGI